MQLLQMQTRFCKPRTLWSWQQNDYAIVKRKLLALCKSKECNSLPTLDRLNVEMGLSLFLGTKVLLRRSSCGCACGLVYVCCVWTDIEKKAEMEALKSTLRGRSSFGAGSK